MSTFMQLPLPSTLHPFRRPSSGAAGVVHRGPVLVTGSHRSGTTWVGNVLAKAPGTFYIHEPFKPEWSPAENWTRFERYFAHIDGTSAGKHENAIARTLESHFNWKRHYRIRPSWSQACDATARWARSTCSRLMHRRAIMKDPIAIFSAPWLAQRFDMSVIVMIRHPAAFVSSIKLKKWWFDFKHWTAQPELCESLLKPFSSEIKRLAERNDDLITQAILQWRAFHHVIRGYQLQHPEWQFVWHEDLSLDPMKGFGRMFHGAGLQFTERCRQEVIASTSAENLTDANVAGKSTRFTNVNSVANVRNWTKRLSADEIKRIRDGTADVASYFYTDADWD